MGGGFDGWWADVRWALRGLRRRPGFTIVAAATLALGIGANTAVITLVSAHFFESLPYEEPDDLVLIWETSRNSTDVTTVAPGNYWTWREEAESFVDIAAYNVDFATLSGEQSAERVDASLVVPHFFSVLGSAPMLGGGFDEASVRASDGLQVVLSHSLWTRRYGADPGIIGRDIRIDGRPHTVMGVMPSAFRQPERSLSWQNTELWRPMLLDESRDNHGSRYLRTIARRKPDVSVEQARLEMEAMARRLVEAFPEENAGRSVLVFTLDDYLLSDARPTLLMLLVAGAAVLLIVCANVANLTLARGEERRSEFAVRAALGSGRRRLVRQIVVEGVVLAVVGAALGTLLVYAGRDLLQTVQVRFFSGLVDARVDVRVIVLTAAAALGSGLLFGLPLARAASKPDLRDALTGARRGMGRTSETTRSLLVIGQVGLATTLLIVAALLSRSFTAMIDVPPGFEPDGIVAFTVSPPTVAYPERTDVLGYHDRLLERVSQIPGVQQVGTVSDLMFTTENMFTTFEIPGRTHDPEARPRAEYHVVLPEYFAVLEIPVIAGTLPDAFVEGDEMPIVVNEAMAAAFWPDGDALGSVATLEWMEPSQMRVVAIVGDVLDDGYVATADPAFFLPFRMAPRRRMSYLVQAAGDPGALFGPLREAVDAIDSDIPAGDLRQLDGMLAESVARPRAASLIGVTFALIALLVSAAGIYGVISYSVQRRTHELGIRSALGAGAGELVSMVMGRTSRQLVIGLVLGTGGALLAGRRLAGLLFGVRVWDPVSLIASVAILALVGMFASWVPARRVVSIDPREALRAE